MLGLLELGILFCENGKKGLKLKAIIRDGICVVMVGMKT